MTTTGGSRPLSGAVRRALAAARIGPGSVVVAGVSGGPDSSALLAALADLAPGLGLRLHACHVDHGIRPAAERAGDLAAVRALCRRLGVPLEVRAVPEGAIAAEARRDGRSLEEVARRHRHAALAGAADAAGGERSFIALGHTLDDHLETVLMRVLQGAGPHGLAGIAARRGRIVRPLLGVSRAVVAAALAADGLVARVDPSNADTRFLRNRLRATLVPALERAAPGWRSSLAALAREAARLARLLDREAARLSWSPRRGGLTVDRRAFFAADPPVRRQALLAAADRLWPGDLPLRLPRRFFAPVLGADPGPANRSLARGHGFALRVQGERLWWGPDIAGPSEKGYLLRVPREGILSIEGTAPGTSARAVVRRGSTALPGETAIPAREVVPPLVLRSRRKGDRLDGPRGSVPVKELCAGWGPGGAEAARVAVLADRRGVVAVLGAPDGRAGAVRADTGAGAPGAGDWILVRIEDGVKERRA